MVVRQHHLFHGPFADSGGRLRDARQDSGVLAHIHQRVDILQPAGAPSTR
jgi:hypothetical protein